MRQPVRHSLRLIVLFLLCLSACDDGNTAGSPTSADVANVDTAPPCVSPDDCDDGDACTADLCDKAKGCKSVAKDCDDGDACTADTCDVVTGCKNKSISCDDGVVCTEDSCLPSSGCKNTASAQLCDDNKSCTDDSCNKATGCINQAKDCDDGNPCTQDTCAAASGCVSTPTVGAKCGNNGTCSGSGVCQECQPKCDAGSCNDGCGGFCAGTCSDGNACTSGDACSSGKCGGQSVNCDDGNACTTDSCDPGNGCKNTLANGTSCADGNPCTENEKCLEGSCIGSAKSCDDLSECTVDSCSANEGCKNVAKASGACGGGAGQCVEGACCVPNCGSAQCGSDGCGGTCGACGASAVCNSGQCEILAEPAIEEIYVTAFPNNGDQVIPSYIAHLFGTSVFGEVLPLSVTKVKNPTKSPVSVTLSAELKGYSQAASAKVDLQPGETKEVALTPTLNFPAIYALTTALAANFEVTLSEAGKQIDVKSPIGSLKLATKNTAFWFVLFNNTPTMMHGFVAAMVTPKNSAVVQLVTDAAYESSGGSMSGYLGIGAEKSLSKVLEPGSYYATSGYYRAGDEIAVTASVTGGSDLNCAYYVMDTVNFNMWKNGVAGAKAVLGADYLGNFTGKYTALADGRYHHIIMNPDDNWSDRTFNVERTMGVDEAADDQLGAIFNALKNKGIVYTSVSTDYFSGAQNVKTPAESLGSGSANCIDGTLVFASALEAIGMEAYLVITKTHAYVAVGWYPGAEVEQWTFLETTMVGSAATFDQAKAAGLKTFQFDELEGNIEQIVSIKAARNAGIVPGGY